MPKTMTLVHFLLFLLLLPLLLCTSATGVVYNIAKFGAQANGKPDSTSSFVQAWASACKSANPATVYVPRGKFVVREVTFQGPCKSTVKFQIDGIIVAPSSYGSYANSPGHGRWIAFDGVSQVSIEGGMLDGRGMALWACKATPGKRCPDGPTSITFNNVKDITVTGLKSVNSKLYHMVITQSERVKVQGVRIVAPGDSPNTDGIHVQQSRGVTILGTNIKTGDDCVSIGPGTSDLWIEGVACGPGHGISIGSLGKEVEEEGVRNVTVRNVSFKGTQNGVRIKTWGRPSNGFVRGVAFQHATMEDVQNPIIIDQNYCPHNIGCPNKNSGIQITQVAYSDIHGTSATPMAVNFDCSPSNPCSEIGLQDIRLTYKDQKAQSHCKHARGMASGLISPPSCF